MKGTSQQGRASVGTNKGVPDREKDVGAPVQADHADAAANDVLERDKVEDRDTEEVKRLIKYSAVA